MNSILCEEAKCVQKLLKLSDKSILIKKRKLDEQYNKLKSECHTLIQRNRYLYAKEKNVVEELKKCKYQFNQKQTLWKEKSFMHMQFSSDMETLKKKVDDIDSKRYLENYIRNIFSTKKKYAELQSIYDVEKLEQETAKLGIEMSMFESDIDEIFEQYKILCKKYESENEDIRNLDKLELIVKFN